MNIQWPSGIFYFKSILSDSNILKYSSIMILSRVVYKEAKLAGCRETGVLNFHRRVRIVRQSAAGGQPLTSEPEKDAGRDGRTGRFHGFRQG